MRLLSYLVVTFSIVTSLAFAEGTKYTCPMHTHYVSEEPGSCPICGMDLVPVESEEPAEISQADMESGARLAITIDPETVQNMGVRTEKVAKLAFGQDIRSYGLVTENVRLKKALASRVSGWVEELNITAVGDEVKEGVHLFSLYSPELVSAQQDYLSALSTGAKGRISSSGKRLKSLGVQEKFIKQLAKKRRKSQNVPFYAEANGIVGELNVNQGSYVKPGMQVAAMQDYTSVWINVSVAEKDLQFLLHSNKASVVFPNLGGMERVATIDYVYPTIDTESRTGQVRLVLDNKNGMLKPGSYADVTFETNVENRLAVPSEAILKSSEGDFAVVALGGGKFQSKRVITGVRTKGRTEILFGLNAGDDIVVSSQFMIDSESALRESFRKLSSSTDAEQMQMPTAEGNPHANH